MKEQDVNRLDQSESTHNPVTAPRRVHSLARKTALIGILSAISIVLALPFLEFTLPLLPVFLKLDFSDVPALLAAFALGPLAGVMVALVKNLLHIPFGTTAGVGELANFVIGGSFVLTAGLIYIRRRTRGGALAGMMTGALVMAAVAVVANYYVMIPLYFQMAGLNEAKLVAMSAAVGNTRVTSLVTYLLWAVVPFNLIKSAVVSLIVLLLYKRLSPLLHGR